MTVALPPSGRTRSAPPDAAYSSSAGARPAPAEGGARPTTGGAAGPDARMRRRNRCRVLGQDLVGRIYRRPLSVVRVDGL